VQPDLADRIKLSPDVKSNTCSGIYYCSPTDNVWTLVSNSVIEQIVLKAIDGYLDELTAQDRRHIQSRTTMANLLMRFFGRYKEKSTNFVCTGSFAGDKDSHDAGLEAMRGMRLIIADELKRTMTLVKSLTGGAVAPITDDASEKICWLHLPHIGHRSGTMLPATRRVQRHCHDAR
jgi:hypothetical protein